MLSRADFSPPYEFYSHAMIKLGARARLLARLGPEAADALDEFVSLALAYEELHSPSLEGVLHWLERGETQIKRDMERARDEVRVMTVHGAKGLEADIVFLPDTTTQAQGAGRHGEFLFTKSGHVVFPVKKEDAPRAVLAAKAEADEEMQRERRRLLYVALTRAKDRLIVCGFETAKGVEPGSWYDLTRRAAQQIGAEVAHDSDTLLVVGDADTEASESTGETAVSLPEKLAQWVYESAAVEHIRPRLLRPSDAAGLEEPATISPLDGRNAARFRRGLLVHTLLARLPEISPEKRKALAIKFLQANKHDEPETLADGTLRVLNDPQFAACFAEGSRAEVAIVADLPELGDGARLNGRIDRLAITDTEVLAIDFKTNRPPPSRTEDVSTLYLAQMALYRAALAKVFPGRRIATALVWTEGPHLMPLPDVLLDREIAKITARLAAA